MLEVLTSTILLLAISIIAALPSAWAVVRYLNDESIIWLIIIQICMLALIQQLLIYWVIGMTIVFILIIAIVKVFSYLDNKPDSKNNNKDMGIMQKVPEEYE